jgi:hypothetical protein
MDEHEKTPGNFHKRISFHLLAAFDFNFNLGTPVSFDPDFGRRGLAWVSNVDQSSGHLLNSMFIEE